MQYDLETGEGVAQIIAELDYYFSALPLIEEQRDELAFLVLELAQAAAEDGYLQGLATGSKK